MINNFFRFSVIILSLTAFFACGDKDEDNKEPLKPAYVEVNSADLALLFTGEAGEKTIAVLANREVEASLSVNWATATITVNEDKSISLKVAVQKSDATKKRTGTITLTTKLADATDKAAAPTEIKIEQAVFGLPEANLLDVVFNPTGAVDNSPLHNTIYDVLPRVNPSEIGGNIGGDAERLWKFTKEYPDYSMNKEYGRYTARFLGGQDGDDAPYGREGGNNRGSCALRVDYANYLNLPTNWKCYEGFTQASGNNAGSELPLNDFGNALYNPRGFSIEVLFRADLVANIDHRNRHIFSAEYLVGTGLNIENIEGVPGIVFLFSADATRYGGGANRVGLTLRCKIEQELPYYHVVAVWDAVTSQTRMYINGKPMKTTGGNGGAEIVGSLTDVGSVAYAQASPNSVLVTGGDSRASSLLSKCFIIGGRPFRADHPLTEKKIYTYGYDNPAAGTTPARESHWGAERLLEDGEIVLLRMYDKALDANEAKVLYDYEKPE
jgi:hypothetical protein